MDGRRRQCQHLHTPNLWLFLPRVQFPTPILPSCPEGTVSLPLTRGAHQLYERIALLTHPRGLIPSRKWTPPPPRPRGASPSRSARRHRRRGARSPRAPGDEPGDGSGPPRHARRSTAPRSCSTPRRPWRRAGPGTRRRATTRRWGSSCSPCRGCGRSSSAPSSPRSAIYPFSRFSPSPPSSPAPN